MTSPRATTPPRRFQSAVADELTPQKQKEKTLPGARGTVPMVDPENTPCFWANAEGPPDTVISNATATAAARNLSFISPVPLGLFVALPNRLALLVLRNVFHAPTVENAVGRDGHALDVGLPAGRAAPIEDDRPGAVLSQLPFDLPDELLAFLHVGFS